MNEIGRIRAAMDRNIIRAGNTSDTPYYTVGDKILDWYLQRHEYLCLQLDHALDPQADLRWIDRYCPVWPYRRPSPASSELAG